MVVNPDVDDYSKTLDHWKSSVKRKNITIY